MPDDTQTREQLVDALRGGQAHATFDQAVNGFPLSLIGVRPAGQPHSAWELLEHLRIAQRDILEFSRSAEHTSPKWPDGYWPDHPTPERESQWEESVRMFHEDASAFEKLVRDPGQDLHTPFPWGDGQTLLREALLIIDHNAYHIGELVLVRRSLGAWGTS